MYYSTELESTLEAVFRETVAREESDVSFTAFIRREHTWI